MTRDEVLARVNEIMAQDFEIDESRLKPEAHLVNDLGLDSLDAVDLVVAVEKKFGCRLDESEVRAMRTLSDIYDCCVRKCNSAGKGE